MNWRVEFHRDFVPEFRALAETVQDEIAALIEKMRVIGPMMKRPASDTLDGSRFSNMKELRFEVDNGAWRVAYAFDPTRKAIPLVAGDKSGYRRSGFTGLCSEKPMKGLPNIWQNWKRRERKNEDERSLRENLRDVSERASAENQEACCRADCRGAYPS